MNNNFLLISDEGDQWFELKVIASGHNIAIQIMPDAKFFQMSLPYAEAVHKDIDNIISSLYDFVTNEKGKFTTYQDDLNHLIIASIAFISKSDPDVAEITFEENSEGRIWSCAYRDKRFFNLGYDD